MPEKDDTKGFRIPRDHCEDEPIRFARCIQPSGVLLCVDAVTGMIVAASANRDMIAELRAPVVGRPLREVWPKLATGAGDGAFMVGDDYWVNRHSDDRTIFIEIEPCTDADRAGALDLTDLGDVLIRLRDADSLETATLVAAEAIRRITGMERVLIYRFDKEGHGEVMAESKVDDWAESFIGFHFPSADIPAQARALYLVSHCRFVPRRDYAQVPVLPELDPRSGQPFDLGRCRLRSLSPMHRLYQENLGVDGAMSISIIDDGKLWGLVVGHHRRCHRVPIPARERVPAIAAGLSMRLAATETAADRAARARHVILHARLLEQIAGADDFVSPLINGEVKLADLFFASGGAVIVQGEGVENDGGMTVFTVGRCPDRDAILAFSLACRDRLVAGVFQTDHAASILPAFAAHADRAAGVMAVTVGDEGRHMILWFRQETVLTKVWGGATPDQVEKEKSAGNYLPRTSFERWVEERREYSVPWQQWQIDIARSLHSALNDVLLRQMRTLRTLEVNTVLQQANAALARHTRELEAANRSLTDARERAEAADKVKAEFLSVINHEFHTPLNAVIGFAGLLTSWENADPTDPEYRAFCGRILDGGKSLLSLLDDIVMLSMMAAGDLTLRRGVVPLSRLIETAAETVRKRTEAACVDLFVDAADPSLVVDGDELSLHKALVHLLHNAVKFSRPGGKVALRVHRRDDGRLDLVISDNGIGMAAPDFEKVMMPFMQADSSTSRRYEGAGLGLPLAKRLVELHGGTLTVESVAGVGTAVTIGVPGDRIVQSDHPVVRDEGGSTV